MPNSPAAPAPTRPGQSADLGQRPARHQQHVPAERRRRQQSFQRQEHQPGRFRAHREQHRHQRRAAFSTTAEPCRAPRRLIWRSVRPFPRPLLKPSQEFRVNTSMYDAQQGSTSGAHIDMSTASGTNNYSRQRLRASRNRLAERRSVFLQRRPQYSRQRKSSRNCTATPPVARSACRSSKTSSLSSSAISTCTTSDQEIGISRIAVPFGLTDDRTAAGLSRTRQRHHLRHCSALPCNFRYSPKSIRRRDRSRRHQSDCLGLVQLQAPQWPISDPLDQQSYVPTVNFPENAYRPRHRLLPRRSGGLPTSTGIVNSKDTLAAQVLLSARSHHRPLRILRACRVSRSISTPAARWLAHQYADRSNQISASSEVFGFVREKVYSTIDSRSPPRNLPRTSRSLDTGASAGGLHHQHLRLDLFPRHQHRRRSTGSTGNVN